MASAFFGEESIAVLFYAKTMLTLITGVITVSVTTALFPKIAEFGQSGKIEEMKSSISSSVVTTMLLVIPATIGIMVLSNPVIELVYQRNAFTSEDTIAVASMMVSYAPFIIFQSLTDVVDRGFYAVGDSKTPVIIVVIQQLINVILNAILIQFFGLNGIAYATVISTFVGASLMIYKFRDNFGSFKFRATLLSLVKIVIITGIMAFVAGKIYAITADNLPHILAVLISILLAALVYGFLILLVRIPEVMELINTIYHKHFRNRKAQKHINTNKSEHIELPKQNRRKIENTRKYESRKRR